MGLRNMTEDQRAAAEAKRLEAMKPKDPMLVIPIHDFAKAGASNEKVRAWLCSVPVRFRNLAILVVTGEATALQIKKLKCLECNGFEEVPERVQNCRVWKCPMWLTRPYQKDEAEQ